MRAFARRYLRNVLLVGSPLVTLILATPPLLNIVIFGAENPFAEALQYLPPFTIFVIYYGATLLAVLALLLLLAALLLPLTLLLGTRPVWVALLHFFCPLLAYLALIQLASGEASTLDGVAVVSSSACLAAIGWWTTSRLRLPPQQQRIEQV